MIEHPRRRGRTCWYGRVVAVGAVMLIAGVAGARAQGGGDSLRPAVSQSDSTHVDSTHAARDSAEAAAADSAVPQRVRVRLGLHYSEAGAPLGSFAGADARTIGFDIVTQRALVWSRAITVHEVLAARLPASSLVAGGPGDVHRFSYAGAAPEAVSVAYNGQPLAGTGTGRGAFDLELYPMEFAERIEILRGARAALFGSGESLIGVNLVEPRYDVEGSYIRLWYAQAPNNTSNADITYARNLDTRTNLSLGFRRFAGDGQYTNEKVSGWSARGAVRWDASRDLTLSLTELFSDHARGMSGGLTETSSSNAILGEVINDTLRERQVRHDLTFAMRWYPDGAPAADTLRSDSTHADSTHGDGTHADSGRVVVRESDAAMRVDASLYIGYARRDLLVGDKLSTLSQTNAAEAYRSRYGLRAAVTLPVGPARFVANGSMQVIGGQPWLDAAAMAEATIADDVTGRAVAKVERTPDLGSWLTFIGEATMRLGDSIALRGTVRSAHQIADITCPTNVTSTTTDERPLDYFRSAVLGEAELDWHAGRWQFEADAFYRTTIAAACDAARYDAPQIAGGGLRLAFPIWILNVDNHVIVTAAASEYRAVPLVTGVSELNTSFLLFGGNLDLRLGTTLEYASGPALIRYRDVQESFYALRSDTLAQGLPPFPLWGAYAQARLGSAFLRIEMRNILGVEQETVQRYPAIGRGVYIGANWALVD